MGSQSYQLQRVEIGFAIDEDEVGFDMAVAMALPVASKRMIAITGRQARVLSE